MSFDEIFYGIHTMNLCFWDVVRLLGRGFNNLIVAFSADLSSSWAANLPRFVRRRDALVLPVHTHHSLSSTPDRRNSQDSQISISLRHVSVESRRNSLDSQLSVKIAEMKTKVARRRTKHSKAKRKARAASARKESTPSIESQISRYWLQAVAANNDPSREEVKFSFE